MKPQAIAGKIYNFKDIISGTKELVGGIHLAIGSSALYPGMLMTAASAIVLVPDLLAYAITYGVTHIGALHVNPDKVVKIEHVLKETARYGTDGLVAGLGLIATFCTTHKIGNFLVKNQVTFSESDEWKEVFGIKAMSSGSKYLTEIMRSNNTSQLGKIQYQEDWKNNMIELSFDESKETQAKWAYLINGKKVQYTHLQQIDKNIQDKEILEKKNHSLILKRGDILRIEKVEKISNNTVWIVDNIYDRVNNGICHFIFKNGESYRGTRLISADNFNENDEVFNKKVKQCNLDDLKKVEVIHAPLEQKLKMSLELFCQNYEANLKQNQNKAEKDGFEKDFYPVEQYVYLDKEVLKKQGGIEVKLKDSTLIYTHIVPHEKRYNDFMRKERGVEYAVKSFNPLEVQDYNLIVPDIKTGLILKTRKTISRFIKIYEGMSNKISEKEKTPAIWDNVVNNEITSSHDWLKDIAKTGIKFKK
jgi:hypothetical protein